MSEALIQVDRLTRLFKLRPASKGLFGWMHPGPAQTLVAVDSLDFTVARGEKIAFIGPNGAGKSTTLRMLCGLLEPTSGTATVCGFTPWQQTRKLASHIGLVFGQRSALWPMLPVRDSFELLAKIYDLDAPTYRQRLQLLTGLFDLSPFWEQQARTLSLGQRMKADIAAALIHAPDVLFLDEPTIGLDVTAKAQLRDHLNRLTAETGTTILLTSHDTDDIESIAERIVLIDHGQKLIDTTLPELKRRYARTKTLRLQTLEPIPPYEHPGVSVIEHSAQNLVLNIDSALIGMEAVVADCLKRFKVQDIEIQNMPLEEVIKTIYLERQAV